MNYYEHHIGDYAAATAHLSWDEDMAYTRLLRVYYHNEQGIPADQAYRLARASSPEQREAVDIVLREFFVLEDGVWVQKRCEEEIARYQDKQSKARKSAEARWSKDRRSDRTADEPAQEMRSQCGRNADAMRAECESNALQTPDTSPSTSLRSVEGARATRLPPGWDPPDDGWAMACNALGSGVALVELEKFRDYWLAKAGKDATKRDWPATWRNWVRRASERETNRRGSAGGGGNSVVDRIRHANAAALADDGEILAADGRDLRAQVGVGIRQDADGSVVEGAFRVIR